MKSNVYKITNIHKGWLAAMPMPSAIENLEYEFKGFADVGIDRIVSLLEKPEEASLGLGEEEALSVKYGMQFSSFPITDMGLPESVSAYREFTLSIYRQIVSGTNVVIHCRAGIGRTGMVCAGILLHHGLQPLEAFSLISQQRGVSVPDTDEQRNWVLSNHKVIVSAV